MGWLIAVCILVLIGSIPIGIQIRYDSEGFLVRILAGWFHYTLIPVKKKKAKNPTEKKSPSKKNKPTAEKTVPAGQPPKKGGNVKDFFPFVKLGLAFLNQFRRKLRINNLKLRMLLAGDDPCDLAVNYGRAWSAMGNLISALENAFVIRSRDCEVECDFTASEISIEAGADITITIGRTLGLAVVYGFYAIKEFLIFRKKRKGGAVS